MIKRKLIIPEFNHPLEKGHDVSEGLERLEKAYIEHVFKSAKYNQSETARLLAVSRGTLRTKLRLYFGDEYL